MEFSGLILFRVCSTSGICRFMSLANLGKFEAVIFFEYFSVLLFSWTPVIQVLCLSYILQVPRRTARHGCRRQPGLSRAQGGRGNHSEYVDSVWLSLKLSTPCMSPLGDAEAWAECCERLVGLKPSHLGFRLSVENFLSHTVSLMAHQIF